MIFSFSIVWSGVPALRHDWAWPLHRADFAGWFQIASSGWSPFGIGSPTEHIERYLLAVPVTLCGLVFGGRICLFLYLLAVGYAVATSGAELAKRFGRADWLVASATAAFLLFNPWTYTEVVAGHIEMILAAAGIAGILARLSSQPRAGDSTALSLYAVLAYSQVQFYLFALALCALAAFLRRGRLPLLTALVAGAPTFVSFAGNFGSLARTPIEIAWQEGQSLDPGSAWRLLGYFTGYASAFAWASWAIGLVCVAACAGAYVARARRATWGFALAIPVLLIALTGLHGPLAPLYADLLQNFAPVAVFRELYDLAGLLAICYAALAAAGSARSRALGGLFAVASCALAGTWLVAGVTRWWVPAERLPWVDVDVAGGQRYALLPAFQPFAFAGLGSGADPDALYRPGGIVPLNEYEPSYPGDAALARFGRTGDAGDLAALGVAGVYGRPWLSASNQPQATARSLRPARPTPLVSLLDVPGLSAFARIGAGRAFFGDVAGLAGPGVPPAWRSLPGVRPILPGKREADPARGWTDARLAFAREPELAQPFGGALTTSRLPFPLGARAPEILAYVRGRLADDRGRTLGTTATGYRWLGLQPDARSLRCEGECVLALTGEAPVLAEPPTGAARPVAAERLLPWLVIAHPPAGSGSATLRLNERYDAHWVALAGTRLLTHLRLDGTVNAWLAVPADAGEVILCNALALLQALFEAFGLIFVGVVLVRAVLYSTP